MALSFWVHVMLWRRISRKVRMLSRTSVGTRENGGRREPIGCGIIVQPAKDTHWLPDRRASAVIERETVRARNEPPLALRFFDGAAGVDLDGLHLYAGIVYCIAKTGGEKTLPPCANSTTTICWL